MVRRRHPYASADATLLSADTIRVIMISRLIVPPDSNLLAMDVIAAEVTS